MSQKDYDMKPRWYVVHTYSGYENKVKTDLEKTVKNRELEDYFFDIVVPMEEQIEIKDGKKKANLRKVFPGEEGFTDGSNYMYMKYAFSVFVTEGQVYGVTVGKKNYFDFWKEDLEDLGHSGLMKF